MMHNLIQNFLILLLAVRTFFGGKLKATITYIVFYRYLDLSDGEINVIRLVWKAALKAALTVVHSVKKRLNNLNERISALDIIVTEMEWSQ